MLEWWTLFFTGVGTITGVLVLANAYLERRNQARKKERSWRDILEWARIAESDDESPTLRALAREALRANGLTEATIAEIKRKDHADALSRLFKPAWQPPQEEVATVERALDSALPPVAPDILKSVTEHIWRLEHAFERARAADRAEDDTRIRTLFVIAIFAGSFILLLAAAVRAVFGAA